MSDLLRIDALEKTFTQGGRSLTVFKGLSLHVAEGEIVALVGQSGSGKSTLLHMAGLLDTPSAGQVIVAGQDAITMKEGERTLMRSRDIGFIYQFHHLLPEFTAQENVAMARVIAGEKPAEAGRKASILLKSLGLGQRLDHRPAELSGGEQQRVAIARALVNEPTLILADEPTGNLDPSTSAEVFELLMDQVSQRHIGALVATHNHDLAAKMDRILELKDGRLV